MSGALKYYPCYLFESSSPQVVWVDLRPLFRRLLRGGMLLSTGAGVYLKVSCPEPSTQGE
jgi:hypothetical protein